MRINKHIKCNRSKESCNKVKSLETINLNYNIDVERKLRLLCHTVSLKQIFPLTVDVKGLNGRLSIRKQWLQVAIKHHRPTFGELNSKQTWSHWILDALENIENLEGPIFPMSLKEYRRTSFIRLLRKHGHKSASILKFVRNELLHINFRTSTFNYRIKSKRFWSLKVAVTNLYNLPVVNYIFIFEPAIFSITFSNFMGEHYKLIFHSPFHYF